MLSSPIFAFFKPIIRKHRSIFVLLAFDGIISGVTAVALPLIAKLETDQLVAQKPLMIFGSEISAFEVFLLILIILLIVNIIERIIRDTIRIVSSAREDYLMNDIQLSLFRMMEQMEVGHTLSARFKSIGRILESQFSDFIRQIIALPSATIATLIKIVGFIGLYTYFEPMLLVVVCIAGVIGYLISGIQRQIQIKYGVAWKLGLGQKQYFYSDLFLRNFSDIATNGAIQTTLTSYDQVLQSSLRQGLKKQWSELAWTIGGILNNDFSEIIIKCIVGYGVFVGTNSVGMVALVVTSLTSIRDMIDKILSSRRNYQDFRFRENLVNLFLRITTPVGSKATIEQNTPEITIKNLTFHYPNLAHYEEQYLQLVKNQIGNLDRKWLKEEFEEIISKIEDAKNHTPPQILRDINLTMKSGKIYGIVGRNGAGKTTLMHLLAGFFREYDGDISLMGDPNTREWKTPLFGRQVSFLTQTPFIMTWGASVRQNLFLGVEESEIHEERAWKYLEDFGLAPKIRQHAQGLESEIGNELDLSGGEKQLVAFIRLLLQDRPIIIMDEGTNQLDAENELLVMNELLKHRKDKIIIFITHRMSTIARADEIFCLENGTISHHGKPTELLEQGDNPYARFYHAQIGSIVS